MAVGGIDLRTFKSIIYFVKKLQYISIYSKYITYNTRDAVFSIVQDVILFYCFM